MCRREDHVSAHNLAGVGDGVSNMSLRWLLAASVLVAACQGGPAGGPSTDQDSAPATSGRGVAASTVASPGPSAPSPTVSSATELANRDDPALRAVAAYHPAVEHVSSGAVCDGTPDFRPGSTDGAWELADAINAFDVAPVIDRVGDGAVFDPIALPDGPNFFPSIGDWLDAHRSTGAASIQGIRTSPGLRSITFMLDRPWEWQGRTYNLRVELAVRSEPECPVRFEAGPVTTWLTEDACLFERVRRPERVLGSCRDAFLPRAGHVAVWMGDELVMLGGLTVVPADAPSAVRVRLDDREPDRFPLHQASAAEAADGGLWVVSDQGLSRYDLIVVNSSVREFVGEKFGHGHVFFAVDIPTGHSRPITEPTAVEGPLRGVWNGEHIYYAGVDDRIVAPRYDPDSDSDSTPAAPRPPSRTRPIRTGLEVGGPRMDSGSPGHAVPAG